jgi:hypothetical protein
LSAAAFRYLMGLEENLTRQLHSLISTLEKWYLRGTLNFFISQRVNPLKI